MHIPALRRGDVNAAKKKVSYTGMVRISSEILIDKDAEFLGRIDLYGRDFSFSSASGHFDKNT